MPYRNTLSVEEVILDYLFEALGGGLFLETQFPRQ